MKAIRAVYYGANFMLKQLVPVEWSYEVVIISVKLLQKVSAET